MSEWLSSTRAEWPKRLTVQLTARRKASGRIGGLGGWLTNLRKVASDGEEMAATGEHGAG